MKAFTNLNTQRSFYLLLSFIGGFVDASSFVIFEAFTGHLTGNSVLSMIYLTQMKWGLLILSIISICGFLLGTITGTLTRVRNLPLISDVSIITAVFMLFTVLFSLYFFVPTLYSDNLAIFIISLSMGLQNGYFNKSGNVSVHPTYITGMTTSCIGAFFKNTPEDNSKKVLLATVCSFIFGALAGGLLSVNYHYAGFSAVLVLLAIAFIFRIRLCQ